MAMRNVGIVGFTAVLGVCLVSAPSEAQMFGNRNVGSSSGSIQKTTAGGRLGSNPSSVRNRVASTPGVANPPNTGSNAGGGAGPGTNNPGGLAKPDSRFVRGNRQRGDFVGSNRSDLNGFVGSTQAVGVGNVAAATNTMRLETGSAKANRPLGPLGKKGMYYPKLDLSSFDEGETEVLVPSSQLSQIEERIRQQGNAGIQLRLEAGVAVLRGEVATKRDSELIESMLGFEPGVDRIRNELKVRGGSYQTTK
ncbi:MAG: BON domain-containing protein [Planctomycetota bacterium]|nr:BON domain-containing protein [Planctomycetota bacterium]